jgi:hypothetical protein
MLQTAFHSAITSQPACVVAQRRSTHPQSPQLQGGHGRRSHRWGCAASTTPRVRPQRPLPYCRQRRRSMASLSMGTSGGRLPSDPRRWQSAKVTATVILTTFYCRSAITGRRNIASPPEPSQTPAIKVAPGHRCSLAHWLHPRSRNQIVRAAPRPKLKPKTAYQVCFAAAEEDCGKSRPRGGCDWATVCMMERMSIQSGRYQLHRPNV